MLPDLVDPLCPLGSSPKESTFFWIPCQLWVCQPQGNWQQRKNPQRVDNAEGGNSSLVLNSTNHPEILITFLNHTQIIQTSADTHRNLYSLQNLWEMNTITLQKFAIRSQNVNSDWVSTRLPPARLLAYWKPGWILFIIVGGKVHWYSAWHTNSQWEQQKEAWEKSVHNYCKVPCSDYRQTIGYAYYPVCHISPPESVPIE